MAEICQLKLKHKNKISIIQLKIHKLLIKSLQNNHYIKIHIQILNKVKIHKKINKYINIILLQIANLYLKEISV